MQIPFLSLKKLTGVILLSLFISSCGIFGIHLKVVNPKKAGAYPKVTRQNDLLAKTTRFRTCFDVYHYELNVKVEPEKKFISGKVIISSKAVTDFDTLQLDLYKNMKVKSIESNHVALNYKRDEGAIFIQMPSHIKQNESFNIEISFEGNPITARRPPWDGGFVWKKDKDGNPWIGVACETEGASLWFPNKDLLSDEADSTDVIITVPKKLMGVSNGVLKDSITSDATTNTYHWHISYPINNYDITIYVGNFKLLHDSYVSTITSKILPLNHYVLPYNYNNAQYHFQQLKKYLAFYEKMFGPYPWQRDGFKLVESPYEGMEHQTAIAYGNGYKNDFENIIDYIILHETAHEWWGNSVTAADLSDGWIHEGFATYAEALYIESIQGYDAYLSYLYNYRVTIKNKRPVVRPREIRYFDYHDEDIYTKGAWVLHTLRTTLNNDSLFFDILRSFRIENNQKQILSETFVDFVSKKTGKDYVWFFKQYLFKREAPMFEYSWNYETLYYRWTCTDSDFILPITINLNGKKIKLSPTTKIQKMELKSAYKESFYDNSIDLYYGVKTNKKLPALFKSNK